MQILTEKLFDNFVLKPKIYFPTCLLLSFLNLDYILIEESVYFFVFFAIFTFFRLVFSYFLGKNFPVFTQKTSYLHIFFATIILQIYSILVLDSLPREITVNFNYILPIVFIIPIIEELFYRYGLFGLKFLILSKFIKNPIILTIFLNSVLFSLVHSNNNQGISFEEEFYVRKIIQIFPLALYLGYLRTKGLRYSVFCHILFNFFSIIGVN